MRTTALLLLGVAAFAVSSDTAEARRIINCGPGMNSNGYACVPITPYRAYRGGYYQPHAYYGAPRRYSGGRHIYGCGPGMNSDGYRCVPIGRRYPGYW